MIDLQNIKIESGNVPQDIVDNLKTIFTTPKGTVPFDRNFGIDVSILDEPINLVQGRLTVEFIRNVKQYEPRTKIKEISFEMINNNVIPKVRIEAA